jgi:hypothetical protein
MATSKIMMIRHAERPNGAAGVMPDGTANPEALTPAGWQRAGALVGLFVPPDGHFAETHLATPRTIYASGVGHHSKACGRSRLWRRLRQNWVFGSTPTIRKATKRHWCKRRRRSAEPS